jgi:hypothetical protein
VAVYNKFQIFVENLLDGILDLFGAPPGDVLKIGLTNTSPNAADTHVDTALSPDVVEATSNASEIASGNGYTEGGGTLANPSGTRAAGTFTLGADEFVWTAAGGTIGPFRYVYLYDNTAGAAATRPVIAWWDYGSALTLQIGETFTVRFNSDPTVGTIFTLA